MGPHPAVAAVRLALGRALAGHPVTTPAFVACSGGADSLALAAALAFESNRTGRPAGLVCIDHGLQDGSAAQAERVGVLGYELGLDPVQVLRVEVGSAGGPEAAARAARYTALRPFLEQGLVLLGHTADDQAETVLLGLGRGSGPRSIAGMRAAQGGYLRPLLALRRSDTEAACRALGLPSWQDPHNSDPRFRRVRLRQEVLPLLEDVLAGGVVEALARTAGQLQADLDTLELLAEQALAAAAADGPHAGSLGVEAVRRQPDGILSRVLKAWAERGGAGPLAAAHVRELGRLVTDWRGQAGVDLPGGYRAERVSGTLRLTAPAGGPSERPCRPGAGAAIETSSASRGETVSVLDDDIEAVVVSAEDIRTKITELAGTIDADYADREPLLVGVLKGAVMFMSDLARGLSRPSTMEFMACSSYGSSTTSSGVVRILKDLDRDVAGRDILIVEDIIDSGLTLSWLLKNLHARNPASVEVVALLRKPDAAKVPVPVKYVGFDIPNEFVVGYGLDYAERYRDLPYIGRLKPSVYGG
ncbi:MAG: tRNA(Ile)-lysidine synthase [Pseudonocardiales bacterium]|jgi:hypoxanthine phosphoribosyltransferase|nr:tRNA(Ile)-lysidine synthase [Pseudonocardiales bacterium]